MKLILRFTFISLSISIILFLSLFLINVSIYDDEAVSIGVYFLSILAFITLAIQNAFKNKPYKELKEMTRNRATNLTIRNMRITIVRFVIKRHNFIITLGLYELVFFLVLKHIYLKTLIELLFLGIAFLFAPILEYSRVFILKRKQGYPKLNMNYIIKENKITLFSEDEVIVVNFMDLENIIPIRNLIFLKTKIVPGYLILKRES
jgi:hypothetical protein